MAGRIGVYVCDCGTNIAGTIDCGRVLERAAGLPGVAVARGNPYMCSDPGQALIRDDIETLGLERVVVAAGLSCSPVELPSGGRDLRLFGSQGEQRAAVLALLLAEQQLAAARTGQHGTLFLDDVMSELDDGRRRLLVRILASAGQSIITTTDKHYFTEQELAEATVIELPLGGSLASGEAAPPADEVRPAPPAADAL